MFRNILKVQKLNTNIKNYCSSQKFLNESLRIKYTHQKNNTIEKIVFNDKLSQIFKHIEDLEKLLDDDKLKNYVNNIMMTQEDSLQNNNEYFITQSEYDKFTAVYNTLLKTK
jgi:hypothetical protein